MDEDQLAATAAAGAAVGGVEESSLGKVCCYYVNAIAADAAEAKHRFAWFVNKDDLKKETLYGVGTRVEARYRRLRNKYLVPFKLHVLVTYFESFDFC
jgi:hypothetical protein